MSRCIQLAKLGAGNVAPNPMVGSVLVYNNRIIGEGFHEKYGAQHAEVNCINSVIEKDIQYIEKSILFVSLEPCAHKGKTPPCVNLILEKKIPHVVIGCRDSFEKVNGKGIQKLLNDSVKVEVGVLENECLNLNKTFFNFHEKKRPFIILKWAQTKDGFIAHENRKPLKISNEITNILVHKWRAYRAGIAVGINTVLKDNPILNVRNWIGNNPVRIIIDIDLEIAEESNVYNDYASTVIINRHKNEMLKNIEFYKMLEKETPINAVLRYTYEKNIQSIIIEGGAKTINGFVKENFWDEAVIIKNRSLKIGKGIFAPILENEIHLNTKNIFTDKIEFYKRK